MSSSSSSSNKLTATTVWIMAIATGLSVANLYYNQPLLAELQKSFSVSVKEIGIIPTLTQLGYALGMLFLVPLGDMIERRKLVVITSVVVTGALLLAATAQNLVTMAVASFLIGLLTMTPQLLLPFAAHLAEPKNRGKVLGFVMSGLLIGILLSRTFSGFVGSLLGWRAVFYFASALMLVLAGSLHFVLPASETSFKGSYVALLKSIVDLVKEEPILRQASFIGAMLFGIFSAIWATLIFLLSTPHFGYGAKEVGLFGLLGAAGAGAAPIMGRVADHKGPLYTMGLGLVMIAFSVLVLGFSATSLIGLIAAIFILDFGVQSVHVSNQTRIFALREDARSRINTVYMFCYFIGGALGSLLGSYGWNVLQWLGVTAVCAAFSLGSLLIFWLGKKSTKKYFL